MVELTPVMEPNTTFNIGGFNRIKTFGRGSRKTNTARDFCTLVKETVYPHLKFKLHHNTQHKTADFLDLLTYVALTKDFTNNGSRTFGILRNDKAPSSRATLHHLKKFEPKELMGVFQNVFEKIYDTAKPYGIFKGKLDVAIDITELPYYGKKSDLMVVGTKHQRGTSNAFRYATINIVEKGKRFTLMALPMSELTPKEKVVKRLIEYAKTKIKINNVYLDRGFFTCKIINLLNEENVKFLMPAIRNPRIRDLMEKHSAPKIIEYKMGVKSGGTKGAGRFRTDSSQFNLVIVNNDEGNKVTFATNLDVEEKEAFRLFELYDKRWGIETSYRVKGEFKPKTTSKSYVVRLFYFLFSVCLYNLWILANIFVGAIIGKITKKPIITAKVFGTLLYTTFYIDDGG